MGRDQSSLLTGVGWARRPTGPVLALVVVVVCLLVGQVIGTVGFGLVFGTLRDLLSSPMGLPAQLTLTMGFLGALVPLAVWVRWKEQRPFASLGFARAHARSGIPIGIVVGLVALSAPILLNVLFGQYELRAVGAASVLASLLALVGFAVQASTEEILIRGYLLQALNRKWGIATAMSVQAVVFTVLHGLNTGLGVVALINLVLIAVLLGFWALTEGGLWGVCAFHTVWNWCQGNVFGVEVSGLNLATTWLDTTSRPGSSELLTGAEFGVEGSLLTTAVLVVALAVGVGFARKARVATG